MDSNTYQCVCDIRTILLPMIVLFSVMVIYGATLGLNIFYLHIQNYDHMLRSTAMLNQLRALRQSFHNKQKDEKGDRKDKEDGPKTTEETTEYVLFSHTISLGVRHILPLSSASRNGWSFFASLKDKMHRFFFPGLRTYLGSRNIIFKDAGDRFLWQSRDAISMLKPRLDKFTVQFSSKFTSRDRL
ncbi:hypothetical protein J6590_017262 [Homalodisca vitripennis]|nr:hypothetical protein J6590_017262 [Homalodisca vitripennis]